MKTFIVMIMGLLLLFSFITVKGEVPPTAMTELKDSSINYRDGSFPGSSKAGYTDEPFWGHILITLQNGSFTDVQFFIRDSTAHEYVDSMYGVNHYAAYPEYMKQCVNDGHGIEIYPQRLLEKQNLDEVDGISGATWSYNIFKASAKAALKDAKITSANPLLGDDERITASVSPNPFGSSVSISYLLPKQGKVRLSVFDERGRLVTTLVNKKQEAGNYQVFWNDTPGDGLYFYRLTIDGKESSGKFEKRK
jgi:major membrane immunogen (membrane-anchored lipoprotein)